MQCRARTLVTTDRVVLLGPDTTLNTGNVDNERTVRHLERI